MTLFSSHIKFRFPWRTYQQRVLDELTGHLDDDRIHVSAAPGAGKTILGLEIARRLDQPTLILCPTRTIQHQWLERYQEFFGHDVEREGWRPSTELAASNPFTITTYQNLHAKHRRNSDDFAKLVSHYKTIALDECHHLRKEWWRTLTATLGLLRGINRIQTIALTATPPFDAGPLEWNRYRTVCGPIDAEISIPELVQSGDLCPHQDYVYLCSPTKAEAFNLEEFHAQLEGIRADIRYHRPAQLAVLGHPWLRRPLEHAPAIKKHIEAFLALNQCAEVMKADLQHPFSIPHKREPALSDGVLEILLNDWFLKHTPQYVFSETSHQRLFKRWGIPRLKSGGQIRIRSSEDIDKLVRHQRAKIDACREIYEHEREKRGSNLRLAILTDYIRKEALFDSEQAAMRVGVVPIMLRLAGNTDPPSQLCQEL